MSINMARPDHLRKNGREGFAIIEEHYGRPVPAGKAVPHGHDQKYLNYHYQNHLQPFVYHGPQICTVRIRPFPNASNETAHLYGGGMVDEDFITSDQAAEFYGGIAIVEHRSRKPYRGA